VSEFTRAGLNYLPIKYDCGQCRKTMDVVHCKAIANFKISPPPFSKSQKIGSIEVCGITDLTTILKKWGHELYYFEDFWLQNSSDSRY
jgi:hypothetical protein